MTERDASPLTEDAVFGGMARDEQRLDGMCRRLRGLWHGSRISPRDPAPDEPVTIAVTVGNDVSLKGMVIRYTTDDSVPNETSTSIPMQPAHVRWETLIWGYVEDWTATIPGQLTGVLVRYRIQALTDTGEHIWADTDQETGEPGLFAYGVDEAQAPRWLRDAVIYQVSVDRFAPDPGSGFHSSASLNDRSGGTLKGLVGHFDHIADLGATTVLLSPMFLSSSRHGDDETDADLETLLDVAHTRGIRVLLDLVTNHVSNNHPAFPDTLRNPQSPERGRVAFSQDGTGSDAMPHLAVDHGEAANDLIAAARVWLERGIDGFRLDDANGPSLAFWSRFRRAMREVKSNVALIGDVVGSAETVASFDGRLDGVPDVLFAHHIRAFFATDLIDSGAFWRFLSRHLAWMPAGLALPSFLDNHDMNRFLWLAHDDTRRLKIAALMQFALPHPPIVFYGTEVGLSQRHTGACPNSSRRIEDSQPPMVWGSGQDRDLRSFYRALIHWRKSQTIFATSPVLVHAGDGGLLVFRAGQWFIAINRSDDDIAIDFARHGEIWLALGTEFDCQLHGSALQLPAMSGAILRATDTYH